MNKIIAFALSSKFGKNIEPIMEVIAATGNPTVASEILLGLYEAPEIPFQDSMLENQQDNKAEIHFQYYDRFKDEVSFSYCRIIRKEAWFKKGDISIEPNIVSERYYSEDAAKELKMSIEEFKETHERAEYHTEVSDKTQFDTKSLADWIAYTKKCYVIVSGDLEDEELMSHNTEVHANLP